MAIASALAALVVADLGYGAAAPALGFDTQRAAELRRFLTEGHRLFAPHPYVGFVARTRAEQRDDPTRPRAWGFDLAKRPGIVRIACLGGSTTHGGYPRFLKRELERELGREVEVQNWGVPGWTTQESLVNWVTCVQDYEPDIVVIHHALNDVAPRRWQGFRSDYAHYRRPWREPTRNPLSRWLVLHSNLWASWAADDGQGFTLGDFVNTPPDRAAGWVSADATAEHLDPATARTFARNVRTLVGLAEGRGARAVLMTMPYKPDLALRSDGKPCLWAAGVEQHNRILRQVASEGDRLLVDAAAVAARAPERVLPLFVDRVHLTPEGARYKARAVARALIDAGWVGRAEGPVRSCRNVRDGRARPTPEPESGNVPAPGA